MTFSRVLFFFCLLGLVLAGAIWMAENPGDLTLYWFGYRIDMPIGMALGITVITFLVLLGLWRLIRIILQAPREFGLARINRRKEKGYRALTKGLTAVAAGDPVEARKQAKLAHDLLGEPPLTLLLAAQAAQLSGDDVTAERYFDALARDPATALLGLRGLAASALKRGDYSAALAHSERALGLAPQAAWAGETAHRLQLKLGHFDAAEQSLKALAKGGVLSTPQAQRRRAALQTEKARRLLAEGTGIGEVDQAITAARNAVKLAGDFAPARLALVQGLIRKGKVKEAARLIEQIWDDAPHPTLGRAFLSALGTEQPLDRAKRAEALARAKPDHPDSHRVAGEANLAARIWGEARRHLERLVEQENETGGPTVETCRLMARLEQGERGGGLAERQWLDQAMSARASADWCCSQCGTIGSGGWETGGWQLVCPRCEAIDSLEWRTPPAASAMTTIATDGPETRPAPASRTLVGVGVAGDMPPLGRAANTAHSAHMVGAAAVAGTAGVAGTAPAKPQAEEGESSATPSGSSVDAARLVN